MRHTFRLLFTAAALLFVPAKIPAQLNSGNADPEIDPKVQRGIELLYNLEFEGAEREFADIVRLRPDHPVGYFFRAMAQWWRILSNFDDESQDQKFYDMLDSVVDMCDKRLEKNSNDVTAMFFKGGAVGFRGRLRANRGKWVGAANDGMVALPLVRKAYELDPNNYDVLLGIGIYNYYADLIPEQYPIVKPLMFFFPNGDRKKGLEQLRIAAERAKYASVEANYFLMQNYFMFEKDYPKSYEIAKKLNARFPRNPVFHRYVGRCLVSLGHLGEANDVFVEIEKRYRAKQIGYDDYDGREAYYYLGKYEFLGGRFDNALRYLFKCDELCRRLDKDGASGFMSLGNLIIAMIYDAQHKRQQALDQYKKVLEMKEYENSHRDARRFIEKPYSRN